MRPIAGGTLAALTALSAAAVAVGIVHGAAARVIPPSMLPGPGPGAVRVAVDTDQPPWRGVVRVQTAVGMRCTGALIGARMVLTAAHCLFGHGTGLLLRPGSIHVLVGYSRGAYAGHARTTAVVTGPGFAVEPDMQPLPSAPVDADWAVLRLDTPLGTADRVLPLAQEVPPPGTPAMLGGYEQDRAQVLIADLACAVTGLVRDAAGSVLLRHSCTATRGVSGARVLARVGPGGSWAVAGLASLAGLGASGGYAVPATAIASDALRVAPGR